MHCWCKWEFHLLWGQIPHINFAVTMLGYLHPLLIRTGIFMMQSTHLYHSCGNAALFIVCCAPWKWSLSSLKKVCEICFQFSQSVCSLLSQGYRTLWNLFERSKTNVCRPWKNAVFLCSKGNRLQCAETMAFSGSAQRKTQGQRRYKEGGRDEGFPRCVVPLREYFVLCVHCGDMHEHHTVVDSRFGWGGPKSKRISGFIPLCPNQSLRALFPHSNVEFVKHFGCDRAPCWRIVSCTRTKMLNAGPLECGVIPRNNCKLRCAIVITDQSSNIFIDFNRHFWVSNMKMIPWGDCLISLCKSADRLACY